jgi:hypothetical protein
LYLDLALSLNNNEQQSVQIEFDVVQNSIQATPTLTHLSHLNGDVLLTSVCPHGFVGIGVPIGADAFVQNFVAKICRVIIDDVEKSDATQEGFLHYQLLRFYQVTRLQYINSHTLLGNRYVQQQQHVDCKIADTLLKRGTKEHSDGWDTPSKTGKQYHQNNTIPMSVYWYLTPFFILKWSAYHIELIEDSDKLYKEVRHRVHTLSGKLNDAHLGVVALTRHRSKHASAYLPFLSTYLHIV